MGGTDGHRGRYAEGDEPGQINGPTFALLTYALLQEQLDRGVEGPVVIGQDTRPSGETLRRAAISAAVELGCEVWDCGIAPTPMLQRIAQERNAMAAIAITASHNAWQDNGHKGMPGSRKLSQSELRAVSDRYWSHVDSGLVIPDYTNSNLVGNRSAELTEWYEEQVLASIREEFGGDTPLDGKRFVVDGAFGAAKSITPRILRELGATVDEFSCDDSGLINEGCGAAKLKGLREFLASRPDITNDPNFVGAVANDGDGDRVMSIGVVPGENGVELVEVNGNHAMWAQAQGEPGIVGTEYTNSGLVLALRGTGIGFEYCKNGDTYVTEALLKKQQAGLPWTRGGEFTGHHIDTTWLSSGDGVRMAAWLAAHAVATGQTFGGMHKSLALWSEDKTEVHLQPGQNGNEIMQTPAVQEMIERLKEQLGDAGRIVVRASGTEPILRGWVETKDIHKAKKVSNHIASVLQLAVDS